jgi:hypothetical protein
MTSTLDAEPRPPVGRRPRTRPWYARLAVPAVVLVAATVALSGGSGDPRPAGELPAPGPLPIRLPAAAELRASPHQVFAHYFPPYPISMDNREAEEDYYARQYLTPEGESGRHAPYGGLLRERPLPRPVSARSEWALEDLRTEVRRAVAAGLDGFTVDLLDLPGGDYWPTVELLLQAAATVDPDFRIVLMPDVTGAGQDPAALAAAVADLAARYSSLFRLDDGRLVVSPFAPERMGAAWWAEWLDVLQRRHGIPVAFVPCFVEEDEQVWETFLPLSYGLSDWGDRSPAFNTDLAGPMAFAHAAGKLWMQPVSFQDQRPAQGIYDEAENTENLRLTWQAAIEGAEWVQLTTWNDYSEGSQFAPSTHIGWGPLDISTYYLARFKSGSWPAIVDDVVYLSHRVQLADARPAEQRVLMELRRGSSPARDDVEVLAFLTEPAVVLLDVDGKGHLYFLAAGVHAVRAPLSPGRVSVQVLRDGELVTAADSPFQVVGTPAVQDEGYHVVSSGRDGYSGSSD